MHDFVHRPDQVADSAFIAHNATVLGDVWLGEESSIWFGAVVRGNTETVCIGRRTNVQDLAVLHADPGCPCVLGDGVTVGHQATVHGATVADGVLIGVRAILLNGRHIGAGSIVAAGALVAEGVEIPPESVVMGMPGRVRRATSDADLERNRRAAENYQRAAQAMRKLAE